MNKNIKWGVIGSGGIARRRTIPEGFTVADNAELSAVFDVNVVTNAEVAKEFNAKAVNRIDELLAAEIEAVYIATPAALHYDQVLTCAQAGKHVLCEKPLGMTIDETEKMIACCKDAGVLLGTGFMMRFQTQHQQALKMIQEEKLGTPVLARAQLSCWYPPMQVAWRQDPSTGGGGSLMDMGGHCIDLLEMFVGKIKKVSCFINNSIHDYKSEDSAVANLFFENGAMGIVDTFFCIPDNSSKNALELYGSKGSILAQGTIGQGDAGRMVAFLEEAGKDYDAQQARAVDEGLVISPEPVNTYLSEVTEFSQAILDGRQPSNNAELGLQSQKILSACYESADSGKTINID